MNKKKLHLIASVIITFTVLYVLFYHLGVSIKKPASLFIAAAVICLGLFPVFSYVKSRGKVSKTERGFTHGDHSLDRQKAAVKWMMAWRYGWAMDHREYLLTKKDLDPNGEESTKIVMNVAEILILCAAKDGLATNEKDWILGFFVCNNYNDRTISFINDYQPPEPTDPALDARLGTLSKDVDEFYGNRATSIKRNIILLALLAADADGVLSDAEYDKIKEIAMGWGIKKEEVKTIQHLVNRQFNLQIERAKAVYPEVADKIPARRPPSHTGD
jgi:hypothetical protein